MDNKIFNKANIDYMELVETLRTKSRDEIKRMIFENHQAQIERIKKISGDDSQMYSELSLILHNETYLQMLLANAFCK